MRVVVDVLVAAVAAGEKDAGALFVGLAVVDAGVVVAAVVVPEIWSFDGCVLAVDSETVEDALDQMVVGTYARM